MNLAEEVRRLARELGLTMTEVARRIGQSPANLSKKLTKGTLSFEDFEKILRAMGVQMDCRFTLPDGRTEEEGSTDPRLRSQMAILEQQLTVERLKSQYFAEARHGLYTALTTISGGLTLAEHHRDDPEKVQRCIDRIRPALNELQALIADDPFNREMGTVAPIPVEEDPEKLLAGKRVLLVDDNALNRSIVQELLEDSGLLVDPAATGSEAVTRMMTAAPGSYDYVLMDLMMPEMNGFDAARVIRALPEKARAQVPIIAMTASTSP